MPRQPKKSAPRRVSKQKAKRTVGKMHRKQAKKNMDTFFLRAKTIFNQVPTQGVTVANYIAGGTQLLGGNLINNAEFNLYRTMYDKFRVNRVRVTCTPKANVLDITAGQNDSKYNLSGDGMIHTVIDRDSTPPMSVARLSRYPSYQAFSLLKKFTRKYDVKYPTGVWLDCQDLTGPQNTQIAAQLGLGGGVYYYAENVLEDNYEIFNEPWAEVKMEFDVVFTGKTTGAITATRDVSGNITSIVITPDTAVSSWVPSPQVNVRGTIDKDTLTQDEVTEVPITDAPIAP